MQDSEVKKILDSGILEDYILGETGPEENVRVEEYAASSSAIREALRELEVSLMMIANTAAIKAPAGLRSEVMKAIAEADQVGQPEGSTPRRGASIRRMNRMVVAASIAAFLFAAIAVSEWYRASNLESELSMLRADYQSLEETVKTNDLQLASLSERYMRVTDSQTEKIVLAGNQVAPDFVIVAYWNPEEKMSYLSIKSQPELPNEECFQLWADVDGEMLSLGVIPESAEGLVPLKFFANAESLNVTIEPKGGSEHPNVARLVASQAIQG